MANLSLRVSSEIRKIEVNDNGDCIEVNLADVQLIKKLEGFISSVDAVRAYGMGILESVSELDTSVIPDDTKSTEENELALSELALSVKQEGQLELARLVDNLKVEFNALFGDNAVDKVFGNGRDVTPSLVKYYEFLNLFIPVVKELIVGANKSKPSPTKPKRGGRR